MGSLSPRTRNAQVALYQSGEVDFLVATDAIGMGLNMDLGHVAFAGLAKFDGKRTRPLHPQEVGQIAGRAGRFRRDGTFGVTGACGPMDEDLVREVEEHQFEPITQALWRNARLDFDSLADLLRSLSEPAPREGLKASEEALDETTLRQLAADEAVSDRARDRSALFRLWDACQTPDFRKTTLEDHVRLARTLFEHLTSGRGRIPDDWMAGQLKQVDRTDGEIDALLHPARRGADPGLCRQPAGLAGRRGPLAGPDPRAGRPAVRHPAREADGSVHRPAHQRADPRPRAIGGTDGRRLGGRDGDGRGPFRRPPAGLAFEGERGATSLEDKALRAAAQRAVAPEVARRLGGLAAEPDEAFALTPDGTVLWRGEAAAALTGDRPFAPRVRLFGELGAAPARERATRRIEAFLAAEAGRRLPSLRRLEAAVTSGGLKGLARGLAYQLIEAGGVLPRQGLERDLKTSSQAERRSLRSLGVRFGAFSLHLAELAGRGRPFAAAFALAAAPHWRPTAGAVAAQPSPRPPPGRWACAALRRPARSPRRWRQLERLDALLRGRPGRARASASPIRRGRNWAGARPRRRR